MSANDRTDRTVREAIAATDQALQVFEALFSEHLMLRAEIQRLQRERDNFEQRLHSYKSGEIA